MVGTIGAGKAKPTGKIDIAVMQFLSRQGEVNPLIRRDGQQPIIFMQCGPIRHTAAKPAGAPRDLEVVPHSRYARIDVAADAGIQDVFRYLANDVARTAAIAAEVRSAVGQGRKVLMLTERTEHLDAIKAELDSLVLAIPVSWKGTLQQYAGRLHREHPSKTDARIIDFVDTGHPALLRMWDKRQRGYRAIGYRVGSDSHLVSEP